MSDDEDNESYTNDNEGEEENEEIEEVDPVERIHELAPLLSSSTTRNHHVVLHDALQVIQGEKGGEARKVLGGTALGMQLACQCHSRRAYQSTARLLSKALVLHARFIASSDDNNTKKDDEERLVGLADALCQLLIQHQEQLDNGTLGGGTNKWDSSLSMMEIVNHSSGNSNNTEEAARKKRTLRDMMELILHDLQLGLVINSTSFDMAGAARVMQALLTVARTSSSSFASSCVKPVKGSMEPHVGRYAPALACLHHLSTTCTTSPTSSSVALPEWRKEGIDILTQQTLGGSRGGAHKFATVSEWHCLGVPLLSSMLSSSHDDEFDKVVAPMLGTKLLAQTESVMGSAAELMHCMGLGVLTKSTTSKTDRVLSQHLEEGAKLLPAAFKQLRSSKDEMKHYAVVLLEAVVACSPGDVATVVQALAACLSSGSKAKGGSAAVTTLTGPEQREAAYVALDRMAQIVFSSLHEVDLSWKSSAVEAANAALEALSTSVARETSSGAGSDAKDKGCRALASWLGVSLVLQVESSSSSSKGLDAAMEFLSSSIVASSSGKAGASSSSSSATARKEFKLRVGTVLTHPFFSNNGQGSSSTATTALVPSLVQKLFASCKPASSMEKGLKAIVDAAVKKHSSGTVGTKLAPTEGLLALYLLLQHAASTSSKGEFTVPPSISKHVCCATSFLYCPSVTAPTNQEELLMLLPRCFALYCQSAPSAMEEVFSQKHSHGAARSLVACAIHPAHASTRQVAQGCLQTILQRQSKALPSKTTKANMVEEILLQELLHVVNFASAQSANDLRRNTMKRSAREAVHPLASDSAPNAILKIARRYDARAVRECGDLLGRSLAQRIRQSTSQGNPGGEKVAEGEEGWAEGIGRALILSQIGCTARGGKPQRKLATERVKKLLSLLYLDSDTDLDNQEDAEKESSVVDMDPVDKAQLAALLALCACDGNVSDDDGSKSKSPSSSSNGTKSPTKKEKDKPKDKAKTNDKDTSQDTTTPLISTNMSSPAVHTAACGVISSLGQIGGSLDLDFEDPTVKAAKPYEMALDVVEQHLPPLLSDRLATCVTQAEAVKTEDMELYRSREGELFQANTDAEAGDGSSGSGTAGGGGSSEKSSNAVKKRQSKPRRQKGDFGAAFEEEEWERQMKKELAEKKKKKAAAAAASGGGDAEEKQRVLTPAEKKLLEQQDGKRIEMRNLLEERYPRTLTCIMTLCNADIMIGNECLPSLREGVIAAVTSKCVALSESASVVDVKGMTEETLCTLAACVYELEEDSASSVAKALSICFHAHKEQQDEKQKNEKSKGSETEKKKDVGNSTSSFPPLPSPCPPSALAVEGMDEFGDTMSAPSFWFLFPILSAALSGPRPVPGCEAALRILDWQTQLFVDGNTLALSLRRDAALAILELLSHDRSLTFHNPTPTEALIHVYTADGRDEDEEEEEESGEANNKKKKGPSVSDISPLLGESGALGRKHCRVASMKTLEAIASEYPTALRANPLVENRVWLNCFDADEEVRQAARSTWRTLKQSSNEEADETSLAPPSKMYAVPLLSLLSHSNSSISAAAADALACGMAMHPDTKERSILRLCNAYIDVYPSASSAATEKKQPLAMQPLPSKKGPITATKPRTVSTGLAAARSVKRVSKPIGAPNQIRRVGVGKPKGKPIKKSTAAALAPKALSKEQLQNQLFVDPSAKKDDKNSDSDEKIAVRIGILRGVSSFADASLGLELEVDQGLKVLVGFLMSYAIADPNERVRSAARNAAKDVIARHGDGEEAIGFLLPHMEGLLKSGNVADLDSLGSLPSDKIHKNVEASDHRKEGAVVALGSVALHLKGDENLDKIDSTIDMLINALKTPSEDVQSSVAASLSKLMKKGRTQARVEGILQNLMKDCMEGNSLAVRRGSAYGVSAVIKGSGIACLKKYDIVKQLEQACSTGSPNKKEGALFAIELLSARLGLLFEPYVIVLLPALLKTFSDGSDYVRSAGNNTAGLIMSKLSAHGVKLVMPAVLSSFDEPEWRTKQASIQMLGSMSHLAPKQLAGALPKVVPKLTEAFSDTHPKVKASAEQALNEISGVIRNPEIASLSPLLVKALTDPAHETKTALEALIETEFLHAIDAPSLALISPVLYRGLRDRAAAVKRYSALIAGNMCSMINDPRDFSPYLPTLLPSLKAVLLDPIPDVRATTAKALGSLTRGLGEDALPDLRPWLLEALTGENHGSVERSGAAQGLTEVLIAGGATVAETVVIEEILPMRNHPKASAREGVLWVLSFLPSSLGQAFAPLIDVSLPALLSGLSDESEPVREVAMRAGRVLIRSHGKAHVDKILPSLEGGLSDDDWRIRFASITLLGDLLSLIGGTKKIVKGDADNEDVRQAERAQAQIALVLGTTKRARVLSRLYLTRSDNALAVRQVAVQVWKTVVSVTPRTLREILHVLVEQIVDYLASGNTEQTVVAGRCLGDIVAKLGDAVLPEIIPVLRDELYRGDVNTRRGACVGLAEVISCSSRDHINKYIGILVKAVQDALCDEDEGVRQMAAGCFQNLYNVVGSRAMDEVVPVLLAAMQGGEDEDDELERERALHGLTGILSIRSHELLPYLMPRLLQRPVSIQHASALASISEVTGDSIHMHFHSIIPVLVSELATFSSDDDDNEKKREKEIRDCTRALFGNVEESGVNPLVSEIGNKCSSDKYKIRKESCWMMGVVCEERKEQQDFYPLVPIMLRELLHRLNDDNKEVLVATNKALTALTKNVPAEALVEHIEFCRNLIGNIVSDARRRKGGVGDGEFLMPGFNMPKGLEPLLPIYQRGILYGSAFIREVAAAGLGELIAITDKKYLAGPFIIKMTGPLLRIVGDRNPSPVKIAIIQTLGLILRKGGPALRAFVPQFQTTFVKALSDPSRLVRLEATKALSLLMPLSTRVDPLIKELVSGSLGNVAAAGDSVGLAAVQAATLEALATVLKHGGKKAKLPDSIPSALKAAKSLIDHGDDGVREGAAKVIGVACELMGVEAATTAVEQLLSNFDPEDKPSEKHGRLHALYRIMKSSIGKDIDQGTFSDVTVLVKKLMQDKTSSVREAACLAVGGIVGSSSDNKSILSDVEPRILACMDSSENMEVHKSIAKGLCAAVRLNPTVFREKAGLRIMDAALRLAMSGNQRVQLAFNDFLWLALSVGDGEEGLEDYSNLASFENARSMKALTTKVLSRMKEVADDD